MTGKELVRTWYERMWNPWNTSVQTEILQPDIMLRGSLGMTYRGYAGISEYMAFVRAAFPDFHNEIELLLEEGDRVFAKLVYTATHRGPLFGIPATGRCVQYAGAALFQICGGRIQDAWVLGDVHGLLTQIQ